MLNRQIKYILFVRLLFSCTAINFLMQKMPVQWIIEHQLNFINALCFVMMDLTNEVSRCCIECRVSCMIILT